MLRELSRTLEQVDGKHVYVYLAKEVKAQVDEIVERLAQLPEVAACYSNCKRRSVTAQEFRAKRYCRGTSL